MLKKGVISVVIILIGVFLLSSFYFDGAKGEEKYKKLLSMVSNDIKQQSNLEQEKYDKKVELIQFLSGSLELKKNDCIEVRVNSEKICNIESLDKFNKCVSNQDLALPPICEKERVFHIETPNYVNSLYFTAYASQTDSKIQNLIKLVKEKGVNSITIDIKTVSGYVSFDMPGGKFGSIKPISNNIIKDIKGLVEELHNNNIYVIGRVVVFKDKLLSNKRPDLALKSIDTGKVWEDYKGLKYLDPNSQEVWDYNADIAKYSYNLGFDEINFDYVRYPTDGVLSNISFPFSGKIIQNNPKWGRIMVIDKFSTYITSKLNNEAPKLKLSADVFGLVTSTNLYKIGQNLESFLLNFDYVGPMIYPSHYGNGYGGFKVPDNNPYEIIKSALSDSIYKIDNLNKQIEQINSYTGVTNTGTVLILGAFVPEREVYNISKIEKTKMRTWIQGFSCTWCRGATLYNREKFRKQIKAIEDLGLNSWWVWSSGSNYYYDWY